MFSGFAMPAIDDSGNGLYFGGGYPAGWAFGITNSSPNVSSFYDPKLYPVPQIDANDIRQTQSPSWLPQLVPYDNAGDKTIKPVDTSYVLVSGDGPPPVTAVAQTQAQTAAATFPVTTKPGIIPGIDNSTLMLLGGGVLLLLVLMKQ